MSIYVGVLNGEHDHHLSWPLDADISIDLTNWREVGKNHNQIVSLNSACCELVTEKGMKRSPIYTRFVSHSLLSYDSTTNTEYLQNDCLQLRVNEVILYSTALINKTPFWQYLNNGYQSLHEFTLTEFSKRKLFGNVCYSSPFYTHHHGCYKMCLRINSNGFGVKDTHVSVFVRLMAGEYDDQLRWPFVGNIDIELLNWREDKGHHKMNLPILASNGFVQVTKGMYGNACGHSHFIAHKSLVYNQVRNTEYLQDDCLRFRINLKC